MSFLLRCDKFRERVDDLVGRDLKPEEAAALMAHGRNCSACGREWRAALERSAALQTLSPWSLEAADIRPPKAGSTAEAVFARLAAGEGLPPVLTVLRRESRVPWRAMAATFAAAVGLGVLTGQGLRNESRVVPPVENVAKSTPAPTSHVPMPLVQLVDAPVRGEFVGRELRRIDGMPELIPLSMVRASSAADGNMEGTTTAGEMLPVTNPQSDPRASQPRPRSRRY